jgi:hypothetical protein
LTFNHFLFSGNYQHAQAGALYHTKPARYDHQVKRVPGVQVFEGIKKGVRVVDVNMAWLVLDSKFLQLTSNSNHPF